jgi:hypothetical protein
MSIIKEGDLCVVAKGDLVFVGAISSANERGVILRSARSIHSGRGAIAIATFGLDSMTGVSPVISEVHLYPADLVLFPKEGVRKKLATLLGLKCHLVEEVA